MSSKDRITINTEDYDEEELFEMANICGKDIKVPHRLDFSFYISIKGNNKHGIRVKPVFNTDNYKYDMAGVLKLYGDWEYISGKDDKHVDSKKIREMKRFFRDYKVLFAGVWEEEIRDAYVQNYLMGYITLKELIQRMRSYEKYKDMLDKVTSIKELEQVVRRYNIFNMND